MTWNARNILVDSSTSTYELEAESSGPIHDRIQRAFADAPRDGSVEWEVCIGRDHRLGHEAKMAVPEIAHQRLTAFMPVLEDCIRLCREIAERMIRN